MAPIRYHSTRSAEPEVSFREAVLQGLAKDGGLFIPSSIPSVPETWRDAEDFPSLATATLGAWLRDEVASAALADISRNALNFRMHIVALDGDEYEGIAILELFHGPTLSFKDFGARTMARLMSHFLRNEDRRLTILVATSGDTGSAVADGFSGLPNVRVVLLYPSGKVSPTQERQLIVRRPGVSALAVEGTFDDCQRMVKEAFADPTLAGFNLSSANSINIGRLLPQMLYYMEAVRTGPFDAPTFCVPSGNLGNLTAGVLAHLAGMPAAGFIAAHNANDFFPRHLLDDGAETRPSIRTHSNAMDVGLPSNFERLRALLTPAAMRGLVRGASITDRETIESMRRIYRQTGYIADPHTAVGLEAARRYRNGGRNGEPIVVLATAHPAKFPEVVSEALGFQPDIPPGLARLLSAETEVRSIPPELDALRGVLEQVSEDVPDAEVE